MSDAETRRLARVMAKILENRSDFAFPSAIYFAKNFQRDRQMDVGRWGSDLLRVRHDGDQEVHEEGGQEVDEEGHGQEVDEEGLGQEVQDQEVRLQDDLSPFGEGPHQVDGRSDPGIEVGLLEVGLIEVGEVAEPLDDLLDAMQAPSRPKDRGIRSPFLNRKKPAGFRLIAAERRACCCNYATLSCSSASI